MFPFNSNTYSVKIKLYVTRKVRATPPPPYLPTFEGQNGGEIGGSKRKLRVRGAKHRKLQKIAKKRQKKTAKKCGRTIFFAGEQTLAGGARLMRAIWQVCPPHKVSFSCVILSNSGEGISRLWSMKFSLLMPISYGPSPDYYK